MENQFDTVVIELQHKGKSVGSVSISQDSLKTLESLHGHDFKTVIADMADTLKTSLNEREPRKNKKG
jgi:hypothetical protein